MADRKFLVFAGTREGRELADFLTEQQIPALVCVATDYGESLLVQNEFIRIRAGRMDRKEIAALIRDVRPIAVIDATHPYADVVTENICRACGQEKTALYRLVREESAPEESEGVKLFDSASDAAAWLSGKPGNILLATGMKELRDFVNRPDLTDRLYVRTLPQGEAIAQMESFGISGKQMICMQGPFTAEMNAATLRMTDAKYLVTRESGRIGGFREKAEAARACGAVCLVIRRPRKERGYSAEEIRKYILRLWNEFSDNSGINSDDSTCCECDAGHSPGSGYRNEKSDENHRIELLNNGWQGSGYRVMQSVPAGRTPEHAYNYVISPESPVHADSYTEISENKHSVTLLGIGMGSEENMTVEAVNACRAADCIIGASRMLESLGRFHKPMVSLYRSDEITNYMEEHPEYKHYVVAFSGDIGFYSGARKLMDRFDDMKDGKKPEIRLLCGISSAAYFAARLRMPWEDMALVSSHGREPNLISAVRKNSRVFTLASDAKSIRSIAEKLVRYGFGDTAFYAGADLSYPTECIYEGLTADFVRFDRPGMFAAVICNERAEHEVVTHGIPDEAFVRGNVPMTKEEVRSISVSKLRLTRDAVVYDIGAGTGSVSVECARMADCGRVYAVEWKEDTWKLIAENRKKFAVSNLEIVSGRAPEILGGLPAPTHAFIGGSGGSLKSILRTLIRKNPDVRIVINCIMIETVRETMEAADELPLDIEDMMTVSIAKAKATGSHHMMTARNPVTVITLCAAQGAVSSRIKPVYPVAG
ncbi:MAG: precorrin-6A reductase [Lachnospiraceae bacterium]|nr:precorrin-6A reductase [Lachnospiraceae bacterium]